VSNRKSDVYAVNVDKFTSTNDDMNLTVTKDMTSSMNLSERRREKIKEDSAQKRKDQISATASHLRISARKMKLAVDLVRGMNAKKAVHILKATPRKACELLAKLLNSAIANADYKHGTKNAIHEQRTQRIDMESLKITRIDVGNGPGLTRFMPRARHGSGMITKYTCNVSVYLNGVFVENTLEQEKEMLGGEEVKING